jgi:hypothetical protein
MYCRLLLFICAYKALENSERVQKRGTKKNDYSADNARPYTAKSSIKLCAKPDRRTAHHPPYSPDLASSNYFLFGYIKDKLKRLPFRQPSTFIVQESKRYSQSIDQHSWPLSTSGLFVLSDVFNCMETTSNGSPKRTTKMIWLIRIAEMPLCMWDTLHLHRLMFDISQKVDQIARVSGLGYAYIESRT